MWRGSTSDQEKSTDSDLRRRSTGSTLLIPVHRGREEALRALLTTVAGATPCSMYPVEVLVVTKDIAEIDSLVRSAFPQFPVPIRTALFPNVETLAQLRNEGVLRVKTEWVHFVDSDTLVPPDYFVTLDREMKQYGSEIQCFQLNFAPLPGGSRWARYEAEVDRWVISRYIGDDGVFGLNGMNFVARPDVLLSIGGFARDLAAAEDVELGYRLHKAGVPVVFLPEVQVLHHYPDRLGDILRRKFWHGRGYALAFGRCPNLFRMRSSKGGLLFLGARNFFRLGFAFYYVLSNAAFFAGVCYHRFLMWSKSKN